MFTHELYSFYMSIISTFPIPLTKLKTPILSPCDGHSVTVFLSCIRVVWLYWLWPTWSRLALCPQISFVFPEHVPCPLGSLAWLTLPDALPERGIEQELPCFACLKNTVALSLCVVNNFTGYGIFPSYLLLVVSLAFSSYFHIFISISFSNFKGVAAVL